MYAATLRESNRYYNQKRSLRIFVNLKSRRQISLNRELYSHIIKINRYTYCACILLEIQRTSYERSVGMFSAGKFTYNPERESRLRTFPACCLSPFLSFSISLSLSTLAVAYNFGIYGINVFCAAPPMYVIPEEMGFR